MPGQRREIASIATIGSSLAGQLDFIYDAPQDAIVEFLGRYVADPMRETMSYLVNGTPSTSSLAGVPAYRFPDGTWMVPQSEFRGCASACIEMLLADGRSTHQVRTQMAGFVSRQDAEGARQAEEEMIEDVSARSEAREPPFLDSGDMASTDAIEVLATAIEAHGPCILSQGGHSRLLDRIDHDADGGAVFSIRDPFTGNRLRIRDHAGFWDGPQRFDPGQAVDFDAVVPQTRWTAIFRPPP